MAALRAPGWTVNYPLWIGTCTSAESPNVPKGRTGWTFCQYSDHGKFDGLTTRLTRSATKAVPPTFWAIPQTELKPIEEMCLSDLR